jgi:WD40 repeat protein
VYVISESDGAVHVWTGSVSDTTATYTQDYNLVNGLSGASGGVDVMDDNSILVGDNYENKILGFKPDHSVWGILEDVPQPRGCAFTPDGNYLWTISQNGSVKKWKRKTPQMWLFH